MFYVIGIVAEATNTGLNSNAKVIFLYTRIVKSLDSVAIYNA
jgi:hypothetical protein